MFDQYDVLAIIEVQYSFTSSCLVINVLLRRQIILLTRKTHTYCRAFSRGAVTTRFYGCLSRLGFEHKSSAGRDNALTQCAINAVFICKNVDLQYNRCFLSVWRLIGFKMLLTALMSMLFCIQYDRFSINIHLYLLCLVQTSIEVILV